MPLGRSRKIQASDLAPLISLAKVSSSLNLNRHRLFRIKNIQFQFEMVST